MKFLIFLFLFTQGLVSNVEAKWSVATFNIRNFDQDYQSGRTNTERLSRILREVKSDVMAFQEVVNVRAFQNLIKQTYPDYQFITSVCGGRGRQRLALVYNSKVFEYQNHYEDSSLAHSFLPINSCGSLRPLLMVSLRGKQDNKTYTFGVAHLKAGGRERDFQKRWLQYERLAEVSRIYSQKNLILLGDFNTTGFNIKNEDYDRFMDFNQSSRMWSVGERIECTSYWKGTLGGEEHQSSLLDHIIFQEKFKNLVENIEVSGHCARLQCKPATPVELGESYQSVSDHCPLKVTLR